MRTDINELKFTKIVDLLKSKTRSMVAKEHDIHRRIEDIKGKAADSGVADVEQAASDFPSHQLASTDCTGLDPAEQRQKEMLYVQLREMQDAEAKLKSIGYTWKASQGNTCGELLLKYSKQSDMNGLLGKMGRLERDLKFLLSIRCRALNFLYVLPPNCIPQISPEWDVDSDVYQATFKDLAATHIFSWQLSTSKSTRLESEAKRVHHHVPCRYQSAIDVFVHELAAEHLKKHRAGVSSKVTQAAESKIQALHRKLQVQLSEMYVWMAAAEGKPVSEVQLEEAIVSGMLLGEAAPWQVGGHASGVRMLFGRRLFMAQNDLARCREQFSMLEIEKSRLFAWLSTTLSHVRERLAVVQNGLTENEEPWGLTQEHGMKFWLRWHARRLRNLRKRAEKKLMHA
eukprot:1160687-Pelagomonas_calceolata.AAC.1